MELNENSGKLVQANVELKLLRAQLNARTKDLAYTRRLLDRSRQQQTALQAWRWIMVRRHAPSVLAFLYVATCRRAVLQVDADAAKDALKRLEARVNRGGATTDQSVAVNERMLRLAARLEQALDTRSAFPLLLDCMLVSARVVLHDLLHMH